MKNIARRIFVLIVFSWLAAGCSTSQAPTPISTSLYPSEPEATYPPAGDRPTSTPEGQGKESEVTYWPTDNWRASTPEEQGIDSQMLAQMLDFIEQQDWDFHSLLVIRHGYILSETYFNSYDQDTLNELYSCTKSFIATLVGIAIDRSLIDGVDPWVLSYFPASGVENVDTLKKSMKLEDLLTMRSGLDWVEGDPAYREMTRSDDWVGHVLDKPMIEPPGTQFNYCSGCSHILSSILQHATGMNTVDFAEETLFTPLGITRYQWESDSSGLSNGGWGLQLTPREMAKLGYLYLHHGEWDGQQIVSSEWVKLASQKHTETDSDLGYGYQWWTYPLYGAYTALGLYGQTIFVVPGSDLIIVTTASSFDNHDSIFRLIDDYIIPAIQDQ